MTAAADTLCAHCGLPVGARGTQRLLDGTPHTFCCYGCCLAYLVHHGNRAESDSVWLLIRLGIGAFLAMNIMALSLLLYSGSLASDNAMLTQGVHVMLWVLATPVLVILGGPFLRDAWQAARAGRLTSDTLISLGALAAYGYSAYSTVSGGAYVYFDTATMLLVVFTLGRYLEATGRARAARSLEPLLQPGQQWATVLEHGGETPRRVSELAPGTLVRVRPGERVPVDGTVLEGESSADEAILTGESRPVPKSPGARMLAGSLNHDGQLVIRCTASGSSTRWGRICQSVRRAWLRKSRVQRAADRVASLFVMAVLIVAGMTLWYWSAHLPLDRALLVALSVLVVACPCALGLAAPLATSLGLAQALRRGCLVRGGVVLEALAHIRLVALDKTGTLTTGTAQVAGHECEPDVTGAELLIRAASLEQGSEHPLARAIVAAARELRVALSPAIRVRALPGHGVVGVVLGQNTAVGRAACMRQLDWALSPTLANRALEAETTGHTVVYVGWAGRVRGILLLSDTLRPEARETIAQLRRLGLPAVLLTGDLPAVARQTAVASGMQAYHAGLGPEDKQALLARYTRTHGAMAMVGDGLNDGPVLASAAVGIAVGTATDLARETADVVLPVGGLARLPWLVELARRTHRTILTNLAWAFGYNLIALAAAVSGLLQPVLAAGLMAGSSLLIVVRSLRLDYRYGDSSAMPSRAGVPGKSEAPGPALPVRAGPVRS
jgi:Cu2+-exporting ATPase